MKKTLLLLSVFLLTHSAFSQTDSLFQFMNSDFGPAEKGSHMFEVRTLFTKMPDGSVMVQDFNRETGKMLQQYYLSSTDKNMRVGLYISYHQNGEMRMKGNYRDGQKRGLWKGWNTDKSLSDSLYFNDGGILQGRIRSLYIGGRVRDTAFYHPDSAGRAIKYLFFETGESRGHGPVINDVENGKWTYIRRSGKLSMEVNYDMGKPLHMQCYDEDGRISKEKCKLEEDAYFPGGSKAWMDYIASSAAKKSKEMTKKNAVGTSVMDFVIGADGNVAGYTVKRSSGNALDTYATDFIKNSPKWVPAKKYNVAIAAFRSQPITFRIE